jgi:uncharacterized membrane protein (UPF0127 family)
MALLQNISKNRSADVALEIADDEFSRTRGLMFRKKIIPILFIFNSSGIFPIHSYFVNGEFDAIYISEGKVAVEVIRKIKPNIPLISPKERSLYLLELPPNLTDRLGIKVGDKISWSGAKAKK